MSDDDVRWLQGVVRIARDGDVIEDPRWEAYGAGTLDQDEAAALRSEARAAGLDDATVTALGPRSAEHDEALAGKLSTLVAGGGPSSGQIPLISGVRERDSRRSDARDAEELPPRDVSPVPREVVAPVPRDVVTPFPRAVGRSVSPPAARARSRTRAALWSAGAAVALAAGVAFFAWRQPLELPAYSLVVEGGERDTRADAPPDASEPVYGPGSAVTITMRPAKRVNGRVSARAFLREIRQSAPDGAGDARLWQVPIDVTDGGVAHIEGAAEVLFQGVPSGRWEIVVAVGEESALPAPAALSSAGAPAAQGLALGRKTVRWRGGAAR